jgi:hypothetical protein
VLFKIHVALSSATHWQLFEQDSLTDNPFLMNTTWFHLAPNTFNFSNTFHGMCCLFQVWAGELLSDNPSTLATPSTEYAVCSFGFC